MFLTQDEVNRIANAISARQRADLGLAFEAVLRRLEHVEDELRILSHEVQQMSDTNTTLDQAVADLGTAATNKIAEDQVIAAEAQQGRNEAADVAKVESIAANLNAETAAEKAADTSAPAPAPVGQVNPIPTATVTNS